VSKQQHEKQLQRARDKRNRERAIHRRERRQRILVFTMVGLLVLSLGAGALIGILQNDPEPPPPPEDDALGAPEEPEPAAEAVCPPVPDDAPEPSGEQFDEPPPFEVEEGVTYVATLQTSCGDIVVELDTDGSPATARNFLGLAAAGFYDGTPFHRIIPGFVIQGGDPTGTGTGGPGYNVADELETAEALEASELGEGLVVYPRGTLAMANSGPDTQGSQFFIVLPEEGQDFPPAYTVFGEVVEGIEVADDIVAGPTQGDLAIDPVVVLGVTIEER
jgi:cyclophilin family peptidyl-prolyl cis-trans isomerase